MKVAEIKNLSTDELKEKIAEVEREYVQLKLNHAVSPLANSSVIKAMRREVARLKTVLRERSINE